MPRLMRFVGLLMVVGFCTVSDSRPIQAQATPDLSAAIIAAMDMQPGTAEARKWLTDEKGHVVGPTSKMKRADVKKLVDDLYAAGALRIYFVSVEQADGVERSQLLTIVLPTDAAARGKVGAVHDAFYKAYLPTVGLADLADGLKFVDMQQPVHPVNLAF